MQHNLVDILQVNPEIQLDIRYSTENNFLGFAVYPLPLCFLHRAAAKALNDVQKEAKSLGFSLKVYDGYRPLSVQQIMWDKVQDERYCSNPAVNKGRHTRGTAVDLILVDKAGNELEMPTAFDDFSEKAHAFAPCSKEAHKNRELLRILMGNQGFHMLSTEWWHFDLMGWKDDLRYPPLDISFEQLGAFGLSHI